jgi:hypothetical protein
VIAVDAETGTQAWRVELGVREDANYSEFTVSQLGGALESTGSIRTACSKARTPGLQLFRRHRV